MKNDPIPRSTQKRSSGTAICLSGGGYRAALFHLGVLRAMHAAGLLAGIQTVSSVSGGSILAGFLAQQKILRPGIEGIQFADWEKEIAAPFRELLTNDIRTGPVLWHLPWDWFWPNPRSWHVQSNFRELVGRGADGDPITLGDLPDSPDFVFCAADLTFGVNWEFRKGRVGSYKSKYANKDHWEMSFAVAASASFPPVFGPVSIDFSRSVKPRDDRHRHLLRHLTLSDGGVYDNLGLEPVFKNHRRVFVSDGGSPFREVAAKSIRARFSRFFGVMMNQVGALRKRQFYADRYNGNYDGALFGIDQTAAGGYGAEFVRDVVSRIRTDLDKFSSAEACVLERHGYEVCCSRLARSFRGGQEGAAPLPPAPHPEWADETAARKALRRSHRRLSLVRLLSW